MPLTKHSEVDQPGCTLWISQVVWMKSCLDVKEAFISLSGLSDFLSLDFPYAYNSKNSNRNDNI